MASISHWATSVFLGQPLPFLSCCWDESSSLSLPGATTWSAPLSSQLAAAEPRLRARVGGAGGAGGRESRPVPPFLGVTCPLGSSSWKAEALAGLKAVPAFTRHSRRKRVTRRESRGRLPGTHFTMVLHQKGFQRFSSRTTQFLTDPGRFTLSSFSGAESGGSWGAWGAGHSPCPRGLGDAGAAAQQQQLRHQGQGVPGSAPGPRELPDPPAGLWAKGMLTATLLPRSWASRLQSSRRPQVSQTSGRGGSLWLHSCLGSFFPRFVLFAPFPCRHFFFLSGTAE